MRIDRLELQNFKKFANLTVDLHPQFTLLIGENGSGKTTILDALAVAAAIWLVNPPDISVSGSGPAIKRNEIRLEAATKGDRTQFVERLPVRITATGSVAGRKNTSWTRQIPADGTWATMQDATEVLHLIREVYRRDLAGEQISAPILAYYGAERGELIAYERMGSEATGPARRWAAFRDCFSGKIYSDDLQKWFRRETMARGNRNGRWRPGFDVVRRAVIKCVPGGEDIWFDADRDQIIITIAGNAQPLNNLSAGQRMMVAMVADLAIKAVTQNAFLIPADELPDETLPEVLKQTPGIVLIDELDVHLHPRWQREVAENLKTTFPSVQFVCTSHSPQIIGELAPEEIRLLDDEKATIPPQSFGLDSDRVLEEVMHASSRDPQTQKLLDKLFALIDAEDFDSARNLLREIQSKLGPDDPEITRALALMSFLESKA